MIAIITYDVAHRKTQDLVTRFILNGYKDIHLVVIPFIERKNFRPIFSHRPSQCVPIDIDTLCTRTGITSTRVEVQDLANYFSQHTYKHIVIGGAGILPVELATNHKVINAHPGYLPYAKGLDAFKWSILKGNPLGVTTHYISPEADEGELIEKRMIPVYFEDSFHNVAYRVYELEIDMLVNAIAIVDKGEASLESLSDDQYTATMRMPHHLEIAMMQKFEDLRKQSKSVVE